MSFLRESDDSERRSSRWDRRAGAGNYLVMVAAHATGTTLAVVALWLASRMIGTSGYGGIVAVVAASQLIGQLTVHWTALAVFRHGCEEFVATGRIAASFWNRLVLLAISLAAVLASSPFWLAPLARWLEIPPDGRWIVLAHLTSTAFAAHVQQSMYAAKLPRFQSMVQTCEKATLVVLLVVLGVSGRASWIAVATTFAVTPAIAAGVGLVRLRTFVMPVAAVEPELMRRMMRFSLPLALFYVVGYLTTNHVDAFFVLRYLSPAALGVYGLAYQIAGNFMQLPALAGSLFTASFITSGYRGEDERVRTFLATTLPSLTLVWSLGCALAAAVGGLLVTSVFDASFHPAGALLWPLLAAAVFAGPVSVAFGPLANARSRTLIPALAAGAAACTNILLNLELIPRFGLVGCAWATTAAFAVSFLVCARLVSKLEPFPIASTVLATTPVLVAALLATRANAWVTIAAALTAAATVGFVERDAFRTALAGTGALGTVAGEPAPETAE